MKFEKKMPYEIHIGSSVNGGFVVTCGCCTLTFTDPKEMTNAILDYINNPAEVEKQYNEAMHCNIYNPRDAMLADPARPPW